MPSLLPASFLNHSGDVSWEFATSDRGTVRAGVRLVARRRIQRLFGADATTQELTALAAAAVGTGAPVDGAGAVWVTAANLEALRAFVRERQQRALPLVAEG